MVKKAYSKEIEKSDSARLLKKAEEERDAMHSELSKGNFNSASSAAIRCSINACNALTVARSGHISTADKHEDVSFLLLDKVKEKDVGKYAQLFRRIVADKSKIDYSQSLVREKAAIRYVSDAQKFLEWIERKMPPEYK
ncbi:MAG: hypothetical protein ACOC78_01460 [Actinomycetota bacterium]